MRYAFLAAVILCFCIVTTLSAASSLANPSFEIQGSGGSVFGGWNQFGNTASSSLAFHGRTAAQVSGQNDGSINVSGFWQQLDCTENEQWRINANVLIQTGFPLVGQCAALVNVEWRNASGGLISYDSFVAADANTSPGQYHSFQVLSTNAPAGTVAMRLLLGVLQGATDPTPQVIFDQITCYSTTYPTIDDVQWNDFPGGRSVMFSGREWRVKGPGFYGPGPNNFGDSAQSVWVDAEDRLHMTIKQINSAWHSSEVTLVDTLGYGDYIFTTVGALDQLGLNTVLGLFIWQYSTVWNPEDSWWNPYNEFDIEYSRWGTPGNQIGQFVAQPWDWPGNIYRYDAQFAPAEVSSHAFRWLPDRVECRSWRGGPADESIENEICTWTYTGPHIPRPEQPRVHINLWYFGSPPAVQQEVILSRFSYVPPGGVVDVAENHAAPVVIQLQQNYPNPFANNTVINFSLAKASSATLEVFDLKGRKVTTLVQGSKAAGEHHISFEAAYLPSGVYIYRLSGEGKSVSRKMLLVK